MLKCLLIIITLLSVSGVSYASGMPAVTFLGDLSLDNASPVRIATDKTGKLYISDTIRGEVRIYSNNGILLKTIRDIGKPLGVGVDKDGYLYIGDEKDGGVLVFDSDGALRYKLGSGDGEFLMPGDISITDSGRVYIVDSKANIVKVYNTAGDYLLSFGSGILNFPSGIYIDEILNEVYISDANKRIIVFDLNGVYKKEIRGRSGMLGFKFLRPQGLTLDDSRLYIVDSYNSCLVVYNRQGSFLGYVGNYGEGDNEYRIPLDVSFDRDNKLFITNYNNSRIEILGIDSFKKLDVNPYIINLSAFEGGEPVSQEVSLSSIPDGISWTSNSGESWISVSPLSGNTPSSATITVDPSNLTRGVYSAPVVFATDSGVESLVILNLNVKETVFYVTPISTELLYQKGKRSLPDAEVYVASEGRSLNWSATTSKSWLVVDPPSGTTPSIARISLKPYVKGFAPGEYNATITFEAGDVSGSPQVVNFKLRIVKAGTIKVITNNDSAEFEIRGPVRFSASGREWSTDLASPGDYTIRFKDIQGYIRPSSRSFSLRSGEEKTIKAYYIKKPVMSHIITGSGSGEAPHISIFGMDGLLAHEFYPVIDKELTGVSGFDMDGDGVDEIVATFDGIRGVYIFKEDGTLTGYYEITSDAMDIKLRSYDINRDGKRDIFVGFRVNSYRIIESLDVARGKFRTVFREYSREPYDFAIGDFDGNAKTEILIVDKKGMKVIPLLPVLSNMDYVIDGVVQRKMVSERVPLLTAGDIDGDGRDEIILGTGIGGDLVVTIYKGDLSNYGISFRLINEYNPQAKLSLVAGDMDGDGLHEIITGSVNNESSIVRLFESDGQFSGFFINLSNYGRGVNLGAGRF